MAARRKPARPKVLPKAQFGGTSAQVLTVFARAVSVLETAQVGYCLVGGLARAFLAEARSTTDVDFAVSAGSEEEVDAVVRQAQASGFVLRELFTKRDGRVATARLTWGGWPVRADLLFRTSGIEASVVRDAVRLEVLPGVTAPVVRRPHLIVMKLVAGRDQDLGDISTLVRGASREDLRRVESLLEEVPEERREQARALWAFLEGRRKDRREDLVPVRVPRKRRK